mmetsp:Transcript_22596/g.66371  ORF Transcript_22596/g.66371 Transcript_22596/m.66371 type:complete len:632 (-) Transcript_22596:41-1936(-)
MTRTHTFTSGRLCLTHLPLSVCLLAGRWGEGGDLVCSNLRRSSRYARDICRTTWRHLLSELFRARKINEAGDCGATRGPCRCLFSSLQSERHPQRHLVGRRHARAPVHLSGRPPGHAAPQLDAAVVAPEAAAASAKDPDHVSEVRASRPSSDRVHAAERDALLALCRLRLLRHQAHAAQAAAGRGRGAVAGHAAQRPEHRGGRLQPRNHRPAVEVVHVRGRVAGRRAGVDRGGQRPHLEVVEDDARRRHLSLGRVDPRQVPLPSARRLERPRRLAVSRVPRPERARVVRGGGHREGLEAVPLGEERDDRLVVPMLAEGRVLRRRPLGALATRRAPCALLAAGRVVSPARHVLAQVAVRVGGDLQPLAQELHRERRLAQHDDPSVHLRRVEHRVGRVERPHELRLGPLPVGPAWEVDERDAALRVLAEAEERRRVVGDGEVVVQVDQYVAVCELGEPLQQVERLPLPVARAAHGPRHVVSDPPPPRERREVGRRAGVEHTRSRRPRTPANLVPRAPADPARAVRKRPVRAKRGEVPARGLAADRLVARALLRGGVAPVVDGRRGTQRRADQAAVSEQRVRAAQPAHLTALARKGGAVHHLIETALVPRVQPHCANRSCNGGGSIPRSASNTA